MDFLGATVEASKRGFAGVAFISAGAPLHSAGPRPRPLPGMRHGRLPGCQFQAVLGTCEEGSGGKFKSLLETPDALFRLLLVAGGVAEHEAVQGRVVAVVLR